ncbi:gliding motility-associated C-terminal domain-containing protein, partial [Salmonella enterica]|uniref:T9SS type B sorting domain-containing protein n=1 Tax=Salmonella enterica TaxID=28901 RepID=UPI003CF7F66C
SQSPTVYLANDARFFLKVTDIAGCVGYDTVYVQVYQGPDYLVPNAFTPNGDGLNDVFRAIPVGMTTPEYFRIFNRYGQVVFETNQY